MQAQNWSTNPTTEIRFEIRNQNNLGKDSGLKAQRCDNSIIDVASNSTHVVVLNNYESYYTLVQ